MRLLNTLYVTEHQTRVTCDHRSLVVSHEAIGRSRVPLEALEAVVLLGHAQVTSQALAACAKRRIRVASIQSNGKLRFVVGGAVGGNVHLRLAQYRAAENRERCVEVARWIVAGKLQNARAMLRRWAGDAHSGHLRRRLNRFESAIGERASGVADVSSGDTIRGFEGEGARIYFLGMRHHLRASECAMPFETRTRRPPRDAVNAALSFAYGLLLSEVVGAIEAVGLDPQVGFLHGVRSGRPSLALDLLEELRPSVADRFVVGLLTRQMVGEMDFVTRMGGACYLSDGARRKFLDAWEGFKAAETRHRILNRLVPRGSLPLIQAIVLARHLRGDLPAYPPYVMDG